MEREERRKTVIEFRWSKVDKKDNTPILKDTEIDELAEMLLADYKPQLLKEPGQVDGLHFLEFYLGATVLNSWTSIMKINQSGVLQLLMMKST
jgi:hypothetical protein